MVRLSGGGGVLCDIPLGCHTGAFAPNCGEVLVFAELYFGAFIWSRVPLLPDNDRT
jgi:hypothetical protein